MALDLQSGNRFLLKSKHSNRIDPVSKRELGILQQGSTAQSGLRLALFTPVSPL